MMTIDEAIEHAFEQANSKKCPKDCREDHRQLGNWLKELKTLKAKEKKEVKRYSWDETHPNYDTVLKSRPLHSGNFATVFNYTDDNGVKHWLTGWYSNRSNYTDDFATNFHGSEQ